MSATGAWPLQKGLVAMIRANDDIMAIVSDVYDAVPEGAAFPFVVVGDGEETDASSFGEVAHDMTPDIQIWDRDGEMTAGDSGSAGYKRAESIAALIVQDLEDNQLSVESHNVIVIDPRGLQTPSRPSADDVSLRLVSLQPHILLEDATVPDTPPEGDTEIILDGGLVVTADPVLTLPTLASLAFHPDYIDGDIFDQYANEEEWEATLPTRYPAFPHYGAGSEIATTVRSFFGRKVYTLANGVYMELSRELDQAYETLWQRQIVYVPGDLVATFNHFFMCGMWNTSGGAVQGYAMYNPSSQAWDNQYQFGNDPGDAPDVALPFASVKDAWHTVILRGVNPGGSTRPRFAVWFDGAFQFEQELMWATLPIVTSGFGYLDVNFNMADSGSRISLALHETVPGTNPYNLTLP